MSGMLDPSSSDCWKIPLICGLIVATGIAIMLSAVAGVAFGIYELIRWIL